jgi:chemotaxis protein CheC
MSNNSFTEDQEIKIIDALKEIINIGMGAASEAISEIINNRIELHVPVVKFVGKEDVATELKRELGEVGIFISQEFEGNINGQAVLAYTKESSMVFLEKILKYGNLNKNFGEIEYAALQEIGNIVLSTVIASMANVLNMNTKLQIPMVLSSLTEGYIRYLNEKRSDSSKTLLIRNSISNTEKTVTGYILILVSLEEFNNVILQLINE